MLYIRKFFELISMLAHATVALLTLVAYAILWFITIIICLPLLIVIGIPLLMVMVCAGTIVLNHGLTEIDKDA